MSQEGDVYAKWIVSTIAASRCHCKGKKLTVQSASIGKKCVMYSARDVVRRWNKRQNNGRSKVRELCVGVALSLAARNIFIAVSLFSAREIRWNRARVPYKSPDAMNMEYWSHDINGNSISGWLSERMIKVSIFLRSWIFNIDGHTTFSDSCYSTLR